VGSHKIYETSEPDDSDDRSGCLKIYTIYICTYYKDDIAPYSPRTILEEDYENYNSFFLFMQQYWDHRGKHDIPGLVNIQKNMENHHFQ
jgi:hypothetical protein